MEKIGLMVKLVVGFLVFAVAVFGFSLAGTVSNLEKKLSNLPTCESKGLEKETETWHSESKQWVISCKQEDRTGLQR